MYTVLIVFQVLVAAALVAIILVQRGPGATMGAAFGSGASGTVFGSRGATGFLTKLTSWLGVAFFGISLTMAVMVARSGDIGQTVDDLGVAGQIDGPAAEQGEEAAAEDAPETPETEADDEFLEVPVGEEEATDDQSEPEEPPSAG
ncbi:preprotein translocase subunit SecG [Wenzhouxiangella sp. XN201]|uniref:preprotein translocase subunit SecG n=1 Tax=Wenzhouxiangella sp. XN201 TaxID=2710755 RepID=UPI0013CDBDC7|nr:preprotein translocase subunit SecG [Wenzhouxiangella sp. XN201]NEZ02937.1 preprotein translocase subunit SecG [Wenzhouxiangella sp. XN201]